ncbi:lasso peptide biosynthesis B2 protein [Kitasatospora sp. NPDC091207]|uniref:lasso peptide biosynthesis B2 protein n=1 Tax=Kitasatospora sp. NPDC091207 TaxID=3364083 RepID=UPI00382F4C18
MSLPHAVPAPRPPWRSRPAALTAIALARVLETLPPHRIRRLLLQLRRGARPATPAQAGAARQAVVALSVRCAGQGCLQRSLAAALLCRLHGSWPTWRTGVRLAPFRAHAWIEADGVPVGEPAELAHFQPVMTIAPVDRGAGERAAR